MTLADDLPLGRGGGPLFDELVADALSDDEFSSAKPNQREHLISRLTAAKDELIESATDGSSASASSSSSVIAGPPIGALRASRDRLSLLVMRRRRLLSGGLLLLYTALGLVAAADAYVMIAFEETSTASLSVLGATCAGIALLRAPVSRRGWWRIDHRFELSRTVDLELTTRLLDAREAEAKELLQRVVRERLRLLFNEISGPSYELKLPITQATGLAETRDPLFISTPASETLSGLLRTMPNGTIGLAGPRGAGKTTLMRLVCESTDGPGAQEQQDPSGRTLKPLFGLLVAAPVEFDARDFLLYLIAQLCLKVLGQPPSDVNLQFNSRYTPRGRIGQLRSSAVPLVSGALAVLGTLLITSVIPRVGSNQAWGAAAITLAGLLGLLYARRPSIERLIGATAVNARGSRAVVSKAGELLESIRFQQTYTSGWSGGLNLPLGAELTHDWGSSRAVNPLSFPDVAATLMEFLELLATEWRVVVGIDELDKMDSDQTARRFLNEIKVIFGITGCFFLISVSEDAMGSFERRGMPFRDVFDSSLDEIVNVPNLDLASSGRLLAERVVGLPEQFVCLCHCLGSGLPRDVIRVARDVVELSNQEPSLASVARHLIKNELVSKSRAASVTLRKIQLEPELSTCMDWFQAEVYGSLDEDSMIRRCELFAEHLGRSLTRLDDGREKANEERQDMLRIGIELVTFEYYAVTVLQLFNNHLDEARYLKWTEPDSAGLLERLTWGRQGFGINARIAWRQISITREGAKIGVVEFPPLWQGAPAGPPNSAARSG